MAGGSPLVFSIPLRIRFRGITVREGVLLRGDAGWGEWSPFLEYDDDTSRPWLACAREAANIGWPEPLRDVVQAQPLPRPRRELDGHPGRRPGRIRVQRIDEQRVEREPDRTAPVRVAAEHAGVGFGRQILDPELLAIDSELVGMIEVPAGDRANTVRAQELILIQHPGEEAAQFFFIHDGEQPASLDTVLADGMNSGR